MRLILLALVACSHPRPVPVVAPAPPVVVAKPPPPAAKPSLWPVPVRVMTWTREGVVQIGELPDSPPSQYPPLWYVEPTRTLDQPALAKLVIALREEHVPGLSLRGQPVGPWLGELEDLPELSALILNDTLVDSSQLGALDVSLRRLYLARTQIDDLALTARLATLEVLDVEDCAITDKGLPTILGFPELHALNLAGTRITDRGGATLGKLTKLSVLDLGGTPVGAATIAAIRPLALTELFIDHTRVGKEIATLAGFAPGLVRFDASSLAVYKPIDTDVEWLAQAPNLIEVGLSGSKIHDPLARSIAARRDLTVLRLAGTLITAAAIEPIAKLVKLEEVDLAQLPVSDAAAAALIAAPNMRVLRLDGTPVTDKALEAKPSPALLELYLSRTRVTDTGLAILDAVPKLEALGLGETEIGDPTIARIGKLPELRTLVLSKAKASHKALAALGQLRELERLYLDETRTDDETMLALAKARGIQVLHVAGTDVSPVSLPVLRNFAHLDELTIGDTRMTSAISNLDAWPHLRTLSVAGLEITDGSLLAIAKRSSLSTLDLSATDVTDPSPLAGLPNLRALGLSNTRLSTSGAATASALAARGVEVIR